MVINGINPFSNLDREHMPTVLCRILWIQIIRGVFTGTAIRFDNILILVAYHDGEIFVLFHAFFGDCFDCPLASIAMHSKDGLDDLWGELTFVREGRLPVRLGHTDG